MKIYVGSQSHRLLLTPGSFLWLMLTPRSTRCIRLLSLPHSLFAARNDSTPFGVTWMCCSLGQPWIAGWRLPPKHICSTETVRALVHPWQILPKRSWLWPNPREGRSQLYRSGELLDILVAFKMAWLKPRFNTHYHEANSELSAFLWCLIKSSHLLGCQALWQHHLLKA